MKSLYARLNDVDRSDNAALTHAFDAWLEERLTQPDSDVDSSSVMAIVRAP